MKTPPPFRSALFALVLPLAAFTAASAQTPTPAATAVPALKPAAETAAPSPTASVSAAPTEKTTTVRKEILDKYDTNHNGVLDPDELAAYEKDRAARKAERLRKYDKNHDGRLDESEVAAMRADHEKERQAKAEKEKASPTPATP